MGLVLFFLAMGVGASAATGQWRVQISGEYEPWAADRQWSADSVAWAAQRALEMLHQEGFLFARVERTDSSAQLVEISPGELGRLGHLAITGTRIFDAGDLVDQLKFREGQPLKPDTLAAWMAAILDRYARDGYHLTTVGIESMMPGVPPLVDVIIRVTEHPRPNLSHIEISGPTRTRPSLLYHMAGLEPFEPLLDYSSARVIARLERSGLFERVDSVRLHVAADSSLIVRVSAVEASPGAFDLALGYERSQSGSSALVGSGHLAMRNLFGGARELEILLHRLPGQVSRISMNGADPYILGLPMRLAVEFRGLQQDSTFGKREYRLEMGYELDSGTSLFGRISRELTRPGLTGLAVVDGRQRVPVATALLAGAGLRITQVDHRFSPTRGYTMEMAVESGFKNTEGDIVRADTVFEHRRLRLARLMAKARVYLPQGQRRIFVAGGEAQLLHAREFDESDLFRFGGANSLRGYDEDRFRSPLVARLLLEYRYTFDQLTYGFVFADFGYVDATRTNESYRGFYPGFGAGFQVRTQAGLISLTLAANSEDPAAVRAHVQLSLGL